MRIFLHLEWVSEQVNALYSTVGRVDFPVDDPLQVGLHAISLIDRLIYPGAYSEGTAIRIKSFTAYKFE